MSHQQAEIGETLPKAFLCVCVCYLEEDMQQRKKAFPPSPPLSS